MQTAIDLRALYPQSHRIVMPDLLRSNLFIVKLCGLLVFQSYYSEVTNFRDREDLFLPNALRNNKFYQTNLYVLLNNSDKLHSIFQK